MNVSHTSFPTRAPPDARHRLSRKDRILLVLEREGNRRLRIFGTLLYRLTGGRCTPRNRAVLLLTTRGRKSGRAHTIILQCFPDDDAMIVVAANSGRPFHPDWFHNLHANPLARVEIMDRAMQVRAEALSDAEAAAFWPRILQRAPGYARYLNATSRAIPLIRLVPIAPGEGA
jgi:deazaflavin-dependent oxidoreductase (nitroreductase family)